MILSYPEAPGVSVPDQFLIPSAIYIEVHERLSRLPVRKLETTSGQCWVSETSEGGGGSGVVCRLSEGDGGWRRVHASLIVDYAG